MTLQTTDHPPELSPLAMFPPENVDGGATGLVSGLVLIALCMAIMTTAVALVFVTVSMT